MESNYKVRKYLFFNRTTNWRPGQRIVIFFFDSAVPQCGDYLRSFTQLAALHPENYYLFVTAEYNSVGMHILDGIPGMLNYNILNDDSTFFKFLQTKAIPCTEFYSELGRLECECHPAAGQVRGYLGKRPNAFFSETDTYKRKITSAVKDKSNVIYEILTSEMRDLQIKQQYEEFNLQDINAFYIPCRPAAAIARRRIPNYPFVDHVGRGFLRQNLGPERTLPQLSRSCGPGLQGISQTKGTYRFAFKSDLALKCEEIRHFRADVVQLGKRQRDFIPERLVLYKHDIMSSDTSHLE